MHIVFVLEYLVIAAVLIGLGSGAVLILAGLTWRLPLIAAIGGAMIATVLMSIWR